MGKVINYTPDEINIIKEFYPLGVDSCLKLLPNRSKQAVIVFAQKIGVRCLHRKPPFRAVGPGFSFKPRPVQRNRYAGPDNPKTLREFSILSDLKNPYSIYLLGFLWADGYVKNKNHIKLKIAATDEDCLDQMFNSLFSWNKYIRKSKTNVQESVEYSLHNPLYYNFLLENDYLIKSGASPDKILKEIL